MTARSLLRIFVLFVALGTPQLSAQEVFGPSSQVLFVSAWEFESITTANHLTRGAPQGNGAYLQGSGYHIAPLRLPPGAYLESMRCFLWDDADTLHSGVDVYQTTVYLDTDIIEPYSGGGNWHVGVTGGGGFQEPSTTVDLTVSYRPSATSSRDYLLQIYLETGDLFRGCEVLWHRTISPAPLTATFSDVPTSDTYFRAVEALNDSGITSGCGGGNFCPNDPVTRAQMASFLARALGLHAPY